MLIGVVVNIVMLLCMYWKELSGKSEEEMIEEGVVEEDVISHKFSPARMSHMSPAPEELTPPHESRSKKGRGSVQCADMQRCLTKKSLILKGFVYVVAIGMLAALLMGLNMSWVAITAALALVVIDFRDAGPCLDKVSYSLLIFFCGMFITVDGFNRTGIPSVFWNLMEPYARINHTSGVVVLSLVILLLSNLASNVPTVLLLGVQVARSAAAISPAAETRSWLILAWVSTVAGNFTLLGSAANLIVCEQARRSPTHGYNLSFWQHILFGVPSTIIVTAIGLPLIQGR